MPISAPTHVGTLDQGLTTSHVFTVPAGGIPQGALLLLRGGATASPSVPTDSRGNVYTSDRLRSQLTSGQFGFTFRTVVATALQSGDSITISTAPTASTMLMTVDYFTYDTGWKASPVDTSNAAQTSTLVWSPGSVTTQNQNDELVVSAICSDSPTTSSTPLNGFTEEQDIAGAVATGFRLVTQYLIVSALGTYTGSGTWSTGTPQGAAMTVAYMPSVSPSLSKIDLSQFPKLVPRR